MLASHEDADRHVRCTPRLAALRFICRKHLRDLHERHDDGYSGVHSNCFGLCTARYLARGASRRRFEVTMHEAKQIFIRIPWVEHPVWSS